MAKVISPDVQALRTSISGHVFTSDDPGYDQARIVWNGAIDRRPAVIVRCVNSADVSAAIGFARQHNLEIAVRGGAHSTAGSSVVDDGLQIDLSGMRTVTVDPVARRSSSGAASTLDSPGPAGTDEGAGGQERAGARSGSAP